MLQFTGSSVPWKIPRMLCKKQVAQFPFYFSWHFTAYINLEELALVWRYHVKPQRLMDVNWAQTVTFFAIENKTWTEKGSVGIETLVLEKVLRLKKWNTDIKKYFILTVFSYADSFHVLSLACRLLYCIILFISYMRIIMKSGSPFPSPPTPALHDKTVTENWNWKPLSLKKNCQRKKEDGPEKKVWRLSLNVKMQKQDNNF